MLPLTKVIKALEGNTSLVATITSKELVVVRSVEGLKLKAL